MCWPKKECINEDEYKKSFSFYGMGRGIHTYFVTDYTEPYGLIEITCGNR